MHQQFKGWSEVQKKLLEIAKKKQKALNVGQRATLSALAERLPNSGVVIADEVGMGKTRIAAAVAKCVNDAGGRVAILIPPGLGYQWRGELRTMGVDSPLVLLGMYQYLQAWESEKADPWFDKPVLLVSHSFTNWRLGKNYQPWRWALLPEIYAYWRKQTNKYLPDHYSKHTDGTLTDDIHPDGVLNDLWVKAAAESIGKAVVHLADKHPARQVIQSLYEQTPWPRHTKWPDALQAEQYERHEQLRPLLEQAVGLGLGVFDLVIVDEAHKSRGQGSILNRLLNTVIHSSAAARILAMTATPIELDVGQWEQMLGRIQVDDSLKIKIAEAVAVYTEAVSKVRLYPSDKDAREKYKNSSKAFECALAPFLLRRDKREEPSVKQFERYSNLSIHSYRHEKEISIATAKLPSPAWKKTVCAAEALSFTARQSDHTIAQRLRLTLGNGHGIAALVDELQRHDEEDRRQLKHDEEVFNRTKAADRPEPDAEIGLAKEKRLERVAWWQKLLVAPFEIPESALFNHPAILAAVEEIERVCRQGEKVLVFGRFTKPLRALVQLLNAREMLHCVKKKKFWPQPKVHENERAAVEAAHKQLNLDGIKLDLGELNKTLYKKYNAMNKQRRHVRANLIANIKKGLKLKANKRTRDLFEAFKKDAAKNQETAQDSDASILVIVTRLILERLGDNTKNPLPKDLAEAFVDLVEAACDRDEDTDDDGQLSEEERSILWSDIRERLSEEHSRSEGGYARLMHGDTKPGTRRILQSAFNRKHAYPKVLVAQSLVGREGLNLHKACRTVVLLHPEWNPGVVEQQIGRVDRLGSLWEEKLEQAIAAGQSPDDLPRIEIRPVIFEGTYDEINWRILRERWDDLRAQLHGIVISPRIAGKYAEKKEITSINEAAPNFSPTPKRRAPTPRAN